MLYILVISCGVKGYCLGSSLSVTLLISCAVGGWGYCFGSSLFYKGLLYFVSIGISIKKVLEFMVDICFATVIIAPSTMTG